MQDHKSLKEHYKFTKEEEHILKDLQPRMNELADKFVDEFYDYIWGFGQTAQFLKNK
ncbi:MAG: protoglobin domain-containing protein, partial [Thiovulaceae bacterium]|nr:protoglobin domain-containing protein [Sulfurimonadaceae bacterium]